MRLIESGGWRIDHDRVIFARDHGTSTTGRLLALKHGITPPAGARVVEVMLEGLSWCPILIGAEADAFWASGNGILTP